MIESNKIPVASKFLIQVRDTPFFEDVFNKVSTLHNLVSAIHFSWTCGNNWVEERKSHFAFFLYAYIWSR